MSTEAKIEKIRDTLNATIIEYGLHHPMVAETSQKLDKIINKYYGEREQRKYRIPSVMQIEYEIALEKLKQLSHEFGEFPTFVEWNSFAKTYGYLSGCSIEYISGLNWHKLRDKLSYKAIK